MMLGRYFGRGRDCLRTIVRWPGVGLAFCNQPCRWSESAADSQQPSMGRADG